MSEINIAYQPQLVSNFPVVLRNKDYTKYVDLLDRIDELLKKSGIEREFVRHHVESVFDNRSEKTNDPNLNLSTKQLQRLSSYAMRALRCNIIGFLLDESLRGLSLRIAESYVLQRFCCCGDILQVRAPSKSLLCEYRNVFPVEMVKAAMDRLLEMASNPENRLELLDPLDASEVYIDCTCLEGNIHFPVDWLLLRDGVRTIIKSILVIRNHGLHHRISSPKEFLRQINTLCIEMNNCRRKKGAKKTRKQILRKMKRLCRVVERHGHRYVKLLCEKFEETDLSEGEAVQIIRRLTTVLDQLPVAREQAHRRIIKAEQLANDEKILSLYDENVSVIKRGKSHAEVEFGNELFLAEQRDGLIIDWKLSPDQPPADTAKLPEFVERLKGSPAPVTAVCSDRGFFSKDNHVFLQEHGIGSFLCPRNPGELNSAMEDEVFRSRQRRRAQTEARVGIVKNCFTGNPSASRIFDYRERHVAWAMLAHNLWILARLPKAEEQELAATG